MVRILISYGVSVLITVLFFTLMYDSVFNNYRGGSLDSLAYEADIMNSMYWPVITKVLLLLAVLYGVLVLPLSWISIKKFSDKKMISFGLFLLVGLLVAGISLVSVEPIIATDYFEYGERQELNKVLESIGYGYANVMVYLCAIFVSVSALAITQVQYKNGND